LLFFHFQKKIVNTLLFFLLNAHFKNRQKILTRIRESSQYKPYNIDRMKPQGDNKEKKQNHWENIKSNYKPSFKGHFHGDFYVLG